MGFWDVQSIESIEPDQPHQPKQTQALATTNYAGIYTNVSGKFIVYGYRLGVKCYVGTYDTLEAAYSSQVHFKQTGETQPKRKTRNNPQEINEELRQLIQDQEE